MHVDMNVFSARDWKLSWLLLLPFVNYAKDWIRCAAECVCVMTSQRYIHCVRQQHNEQCGPGVQSSVHAMFVELFVQLGQLAAAAPVGLHSQQCAPGWTSC